jgi:hypothetical protein
MNTYTDIFGLIIATIIVSPILLPSFHLIIPVMKFNEWAPLQGSPFTKSQNKYDKRKKSC